MAESKTIAASVRAPGLVAGESCVQFVPFHVQVSPVKVDPPNKTTPEDAESKTTEAPSRGLGLVAGESYVQFVPFHVQVSPKGLPLWSNPPNNTTSFVAAS